MLHNLIFYSILPFKNLNTIKMQILPLKKVFLLEDVKFLFNSLSQRLS